MTVSWLHPICPQPSLETEATSGSRARMIPPVQISHKLSWPSVTDDGAGELWIMLVSLTYSSICLRHLLRLLPVVRIILIKPLNRPKKMSLQMLPLHNLLTLLYALIFQYLCESLFFFLTD